MSLKLRSSVFQHVNQVRFYLPSEVPRELIFASLYSTAPDVMCRHHGKPLVLQPSPQYQYVRRYSRPKGFFGDLLHNIKEDLGKSKEMKENIKKFREEAEKLEKSQALKDVRKKYETIEEETDRSSKVLKETLQGLSSKVKEGYDDFKDTEIGKRTSGIAQNISDTAKTAGQTISSGAEKIAKSSAARTFSQGVGTVRESIDEELIRADIYTAPSKLKKRSDFKAIKKNEQTLEANTTATGVELHKDSYWHQKWEAFKDGNPAVNKLFDMKTKMEESDHFAAQTARFLQHCVGRVFGSVFQTTKISEVFTEITKVDPSFSQDKFLLMCKSIILPNVMEAFYTANLPILEDWCSTVAFRKLSADFTPLLERGAKFDVTIVDITEPEILNAAFENGIPTMVVTYHLQAVFVIRDSKTGKPLFSSSDENSLSGNENEVLRYTWMVAFMRDLEEMDAVAGWKIGDFHFFKTAMTF